MAAFDYIINLTGDCQNNNSGVISIFLSGGTPPYTVDWVEPNLGSDDLLILEPSIRSSLSAGVYAVRVNDSTLPINNEFYINIPLSDGVCASILDVRNSFCGLSNGAVTGTSNSDFSSTNFYLYKIDDEFVDSGTTSTSFIVFDSLAVGTYYIVAEDLGGCTGRSADFIIEDSSNFDFGLYVIPNSSCGGTPIGKIYVTGLTGNPPFSYVWSTGSIEENITGLTAGNYSVSITDSEGCTKTKEGQVVNVNPVGLGIFTSVPPDCLTNNGSLTMIITGGTAPFYYSASTGYVEVSYSRNFTLSNLAPGPYTILVTDAGLCSVQASATLLTPVGFTSINIQSENSFCSENNGKIIINVQGGIAPYKYTLVSPSGGTDIVTTNQLTQTFDNLTPGTYDLFVESSSDPDDPTKVCAYNEEIIILAENKFSITTSVTGTTCGNNNGIVKVLASSGGTLPYIYTIDGINDLDGIFGNLTAGPHVITVSDSSGCKISENVIVPTSQTLDFSLYTTSCGTGNQGKITAFIGSGTPPFTFQWSDNIVGNPQTIQVSNLTGGTYTLTIIDSNGCTKKRKTCVVCDENLVSYQTYLMGSEKIQVEAPTKLGLLQMLNEGFFDLTEDNSECHLNSAIYSIKVTINPSGFTSSETIPFTSTTLNQVPADNLYYDTLKNLLLTVPGISSVVIDPLNNQITIQTNPANPVLNNQQIIIELIIFYDIICLT